MQIIEDLAALDNNASQSYRKRTVIQLFLTAATYATESDPRQRMPDCSEESFPTLGMPSLQSGSGLVDANANEDGVEEEWGLSARLSISSWR
mmetsp:Transcript_21487/g.50928  ORF Transcript_21487/g.50928 Transcript_21487/m.50928 type:complete len:92 (-) Transcript_21487:223-498(-)